MGAGGAPRLVFEVDMGMRQGVVVVRRDVGRRLVGAPAAAADLDWAPEKTWVFVVGLLEWEREDLWSPFPEAMVDRRDEQLAEFFRDAGVDDDRVVYLQDAEATKVGIEEAFIDLLDQTDEDDLLVFYFCGHGHRDAESGRDVVRLLRRRRRKLQWLERAADLHDD